MTTIYDVARLARVSPKTVSRVLNEPQAVRADTRDAVRQAMQQLDYVPSTAARSIRSRKSGLFGLITGAISQTSNSQEAAGLPELYIVQGIQQELAGSGKTLLIADTGGQTEQVAELIRTLHEHRVEGLFYVADHHKSIEPLPTGTLTTVLLNCFDDSNTPCFLPDDYDGQYQLTQALIARGHRRIAYITLDPSLRATELRLRGYRDALQQAGIAYDAALVMPGENRGQPNDQSLIEAAVQQLLSGRHTPPSLICCGNDRIAIAVYAFLRHQNMRIPQDISVTGYDDYKIITETLHPTLTSVTLPYHEMGRQAARWLIQATCDPSQPCNTPRHIASAIQWRQSVQTLYDAA